MRQISSITSQLERRVLNTPKDNYAFIKPIKQSFVKNADTMPMTRIMVALLSGWSGDERAIETTTGIIGKHLSRSRRQVFRYLKQAAEQGILVYSRTKDRIGRYTGIKIFLNFDLIRHKSKPKKRRKAAQNLDVTRESETNYKYRYKLASDAEFMKRLEAICHRNGFDPPPVQS